MFLGHFAVGFAAKRASPKSSLGTMIAAACFLDLLWPIFVLTGLEWFRIVPGDTAMTPLSFEHYPWSHSLLLTAAWGLVYGAFVFWWGSGVRGGSLAGLAVVSHWALDYATHRPDLPIVPWSGVKVGLGLWNAPAVAIPLELGLFAVGVGLYVGGTKARDAIGRWALWSFVAVLVLLYAANLTGPPPPGPQVVAWADLIAVVFLAWAVWADRHRSPRAPGSGGAIAPA
ncbi:MAG TPA: hypothetical protein VFS09_10125 [Candidatus Eisenbacteria bacterium]|nr:hypothetical protein [Candidatus Eisenbacteria bacterium]